MCRSRRSSRIVSIRIWSPSGSRTYRSGCERRPTRSCSPSSSAANSTASARLPTPGGPWKRYACATPSWSAERSSAFASGCSGTFSNVVTNLLRNVVHGPVALDRDDPLGEEAGELAVAVVDEGHEPLALALDPVAGARRPFHGLVDVDEEEEGDVGQDPADRIEVQGEHALDPEPSRDPLVDER